MPVLLGSGTLKSPKEYQHDGFSFSHLISRLCIGLHHIHTDQVSHQSSQPCKPDTCPECAPLLHQVTPEEGIVAAVLPQDPYLQHFNGYIELVEDDSSQFRDSPALVSPTSEKPISPELLWHLSHHPSMDQGSISMPDGPPDLSSVPPKNSYRAAVVY